MSGAVGRWVKRWPAVSVAVLTAIGAILWFVVLPADSAVSSDDGAYAIQARAVADGSWSVPHALAHVDPTGSAYPYQNSIIADRGMFPAAGHVAWVSMQSLAWRGFGASGLHLLPVIGLVGAVAASAAMATAVGRPELRWLSAALAALSPLLYNALQLWAHAPVAGFVGAAMWAAIQCAKTVTATRVAVLLGAAGAAGLLRDDGAIFALAIGAVLLFGGVLRRRGGEVLVGAAACVTSVAGYLVAEELTERITGPVIRSTAGLGGGGASRITSLGSALRAALHTFVTSVDAPRSFLLTVAAMGAAAIAVCVLVRERHPAASAALFATAATVLAVKTMTAPGEPITGLFGAFPLVVVAFARPLRAFGPAERQVLASVALGAAGIALTQYADGGGLNWGGRFVAAGIPGLAVLVAGGYGHLRRSVPTNRAVLASMVALALVPVVASLVADASIRLRHDRIIDRLERADPALPVVTSNPSIARVAWRTYPETQWLAVPGPEGGVGGRLLRQLMRDGGLDEVNLFGVPPMEVEVLAPRRAPMDTEEPVVVAVQD